MLHFNLYYWRFKTPLSNVTTITITITEQNIRLEELVHVIDQYKILTLKFCSSKFKDSALANSLLSYTQCYICS